MKNRPLKTILWIALTLALTAETAQAKPLRFVYLQGFLSCSYSNQAPVRKFLELTANHPDARMYWGCFDAGFVQHIEDWRERFYIYTIESDGSWSKAQEMNPKTAPMEISLMLLNEIHERTNASDPSSDEKIMDVFLAGHSHGGWMAIRTAYQLSLNSNVQIQHLLTIDPISYELCASSWFPYHVLTNTVRWWGTPHDCHRAPRDLEHLEDTVARATETRWTNIYQETMPYVTSGPIRQATRNFTYQSKSTFDWLTAHRAALLDSTTWTTFYRELSAFSQSPN
jgi:hypothetical protein